MAFIAGHRTQILAGKYDLSNYLNTHAASGGQSMHDTSTFMNEAKTYIPGQTDGSVSLTGLYEDDTDLDPTAGTTIVFNEYMDSLVGAASATPVTALHEVTTVGGRASMILGHCTSYGIEIPVDGVVSVSAEFQSTDYGVWPGVALQGGVVATGATGNGTDYDTSVATTATGAVGFLHMVANTRDAGSAIVKIQHAADSTGSPGTYADLIEFSSVAALATATEAIAATGTVNQWLRYTITVTAGSTGTFSFYTSLARFNP